MGDNGYRHPDPDIESLKQSISLVEVVKAAGVALTGEPPDFRGRCPFHAERTGSFVVTVTPERQLWHCLGCDRGGDVFDFLAAKDGMSFAQALQHLRRLAGQVNNPAPSLPSKPTVRKAPASDTALPGNFTRTELLERVAAFYSHRLRDSTVAQAYLKSRGLAIPDLWDAFQIGYSDGSLLKTLGQDSEVKAALQAVGVVNAEGKEHFYGCVVVPLAHPDQGTVGLYGRRIRADARLPHMYLPGPRRGVLNWQSLRSSSTVVLTESVFDALSVWVAGRRDVTCMYGVNGFHDDLEALLERFEVSQVTFCLDADAAGQEAVRKLSGLLLGWRMRGARVALPAKDPNEVLCQHGPEALKQALAEAMPLVPLPVAKALPTPSPDDVSPGESRTLLPVSNPPAAAEDGIVMAWGSIRYKLIPHPPFTGSKLKALLEVEHDDQVHTDNLPDLFSQRVRQQAATQASRRLGYPREEAEKHLAALLREAQNWVTARRAEAPQTSLFSAPPPPDMTDEAREDALAFLRHPQLMDMIVQDTEALGHVGDDNAKKLVYCIAVSRRRGEPLSGIILSQSGTGKTTLSSVIQRLTPPEDLVALSRISPKAFNYMPRLSVKLKLVTMEEGVGAEEALYTMRILQTAPVFRSAVTYTDPLTGEMSTRIYEVEGPIAYLETTTNPRIHHENATRAFEVTLNESEAQTRRIHELQRQRRSLEYQLATAAEYVDPDGVCERHHNAQRLLKPLLVLNRFGRHLTFPSRRLRTRRDHERFLSLVDTVALLHQYQREQGVLPRPGRPVPYVVATVDDYRMAYELAKGVLDVTLHDLSRHAQDLKTLIWDMMAVQVEGDVEAVYQETFTRRQVREFTQWEEHRLRDTLTELAEFEHLVVIGGGGHGATYRYRLLPDAGYGPNMEGLTTPDELAARVAAEEAAAPRRQPRSA